MDKDHKDHQVKEEIREMLENLVPEDHQDNQDQRGNGADLDFQDQEEKRDQWVRQGNRENEDLQVNTHFCLQFSTH